MQTSFPQRIGAPAGRVLAVVLAALALAALLVPGKASAEPKVAGQDYPPATNYRTQRLTHEPTNAMPTSTVSRSIYLVSGTYHWTVDIGTVSECANPASCPVKARRYIWLIEGTYAWHCYLDPGSAGYVEWCTLKRDGYPQESLTSPVFNLGASGDRTWGGFLYRTGD